jgi:predicted nucleic acid-binding protein
VADGSIDAARLPAILRHVAVDRPYWTLVEVGIDVLAGAEALVAIHPIRTVDAIHVASAQVFAARLPMRGLTFVSADKRQAETAAAVGLAATHIE